MTIAQRMKLIINQMPGDGPNLDVEDVQRVLKVGRKTVEKLIKTGEIDAYIINPEAQRKMYRVTKAALAAYIVKNEELTKGEIAE